MTANAAKRPPASISRTPQIVWISLGNALGVSLQTQHPCGLAGGAFKTGSVWFCYQGEGATPGMAVEKFFFNRCKYPTPRGF
jgi:hypothetical protein